jgi:hypothetical protein
LPETKMGRTNVLRLSLALMLAATPVLAESDLIAIDVLLQPNQTMLTVAQDWNARLREQMPEGFELDATHTPHVTLLQTYIAADEVDAVLNAISQTAATFELGQLRMEATGLYNIEGLQGIVIAPSPELLDIQTAVIAAVEPFRRRNGGEDAFVPDPTGTPFNPFLFSYVDTFNPDRTGANYNPHVSTGVGPADWLAAREAEPFESFAFGTTGIAVYRLGNFGTAAARLSAP